MEQVLVYSNIIMVFVTLGLVYVTWRYTKHTQKMSDVMIMDFKLRVEPRYEIKCEIFTKGQFGIAGRIEIKNTGISPIYIKDRYLYIEEIISDSIENPVLKLQPDLEIIKPEDVSVFKYEAYIKDVAKNPDMLDEDFFGKACNIFLKLAIAGPTHQFKHETIKVI